MDSKFSDKILRLGDKYCHQSRKLDEIYNKLSTMGYSIARQEETIKNLETLIDRKRVDFEETIEFHSMKRDKEYTRPVTDIKIELKNPFAVDTIKQFLREQVEMLTKELDKMVIEGETLYAQYVDGIKVSLLQIEK